ncbi:MULTISPECIES: hypothetical protein [Candidatus Ichthyocystis]|uniref:Uncharacterized protein n=1 Tax=Candidatus Ichthyocystis hellenicum TaxID=1561003 RepID=A0A0S4M2G8_9BURK|nr:MULTISPECIES: hypothetical protein [Ichthyocystis]CUT17961.1 hypothetical protein Ark11_1148 [Candidatus Ichthyocystis hellenicum]
MDCSGIHCSASGSASNDEEAGTSGDLLGGNACLLEDAPESEFDFMKIDFSLVGLDWDLVSDIKHSIDNNDAPKYRSSVGVFLGRCMAESLRYVRSITIPPCRLNDGINYDPLPNKDRYLFIDVGFCDYREGAEPEAAYECLQYMCDYFKYYFLESQLEGFEESEEATDDMEVEVIEPLPALLDNTDNSTKIIRVTSEGVALVVEEERGDRFHTGDNLSCLDKENLASSSDELDLISSIARESLNLVSTKESIMKNSLLEREVGIRNTEIFTRDMLIKNFMEYYLLVKDQLRFISDSRFVGKTDLINEEFDLPVPGDISELVREKISDEFGVRRYASEKGDKFFCNGKLSSSSLSMSDPIKSRIDHVRENVMPIVANRMKDYLLNSKYVEDNVLVQVQSKSYIVNIRNKKEAEHSE